MTHHDAATREVEFNDRFLAFAAHWGFRPRACAPYRARTNETDEGINNKLRVIARRAYGFHSHGPLISMLYLCCGGIELAPPLPTRS